MSCFDGVITVDGASGTGKSTLLKALSQRYDALPIEFGPVVRTVALWAKRNRISAVEAVALMARMDATGGLSIAEPSAVSLAASEVVIGGVPMRQQIFSSQLNDAIETTSREPTATNWIAELIRARVSGKRAVLSGREMASFACPGAALRIRLEASARVRVDRKRRQLMAAGMRPHWSDDAQLLGPTREAQLLIDTTALSIEDVQKAAFRAVESRLDWKEAPPPALVPRDNLGPGAKAELVTAGHLLTR